MVQPIGGPPYKGGFPTPPTKPSGPSNKPLGSSPGLLTSTGGLYGTNGVLLTPVYNTVSNKSYVLIMDPNNFNCEEEGQYNFKQEIPGNPPQEGRTVTCHLIILKYRELGNASFTIYVTVYICATDSFLTFPFNVTIPPIPLSSQQRKQSFPDRQIHTLYIPLSNVVGERPQVSYIRAGGSGPLSITSLTLCGEADEQPQS